MPPDASAQDREIIQRVRSFTMTSPARILATIMAGRHVASLGIPGAIVECGVWRGGSTMAIALSLMHSNCASVPIYLFDTFDGMPQPEPADGTRAMKTWNAKRTPNGHSDWCLAGVDEVRRNMESTGYPGCYIHYVKGRVEDTLPDQAPDAISLLRLDTDFYASTKHELRHLFPRLSIGGVLIIDDYGHWCGCRKAVDEYLVETGTSIFLARIDETGRIGVKLPPCTATAHRKSPVQQG